MMRGKFITLEGGEGTGKSTQARLLGEALESHGLSVVVTREPGGTPGAEAIRALLLAPPGKGWDVHAEALLFAAARADHVGNLIKPALEEGKWVVCDRFLDSSRAYQGVAGELSDRNVCLLHDVGSEGLLPDLTVLLAVSEGQVAERLARRDGDNSDAIGGRSSHYHRKVAEAFESFARQDPDRFVTIDAGGTVERVHARVLEAVLPIVERQDAC